MGKRSFTLVEIMVVVIIVGILATVAIPNYRNFIEDSNAKVCETNLVALQQALDIYAMEHDQMPGSLSQLPGEYVDRAFVKIMQQKDAWKIKLAYSVVDWQSRGLVYAAFLKDDVARGNQNLVTCPSAAPGANSYGINSIVANKKLVDYGRISPDTVLIADSSSATFDSAQLANLSRRHKHSQILSSTDYALAIEKGGEVVETNAAGTLSPRGSVSEACNHAKQECNEKINHCLNEHPTATIGWCKEHDQDVIDKCGSAIGQACGVGHN